MCSLSYSSIASKPKSIFKFDKPFDDIIDNYTEKLKEFSKAHCTPGLEGEFWSLYKNFRGEGYYIPSLLNSTLDRITVSRFLPELERKVEWIESLIQRVKKLKTFNHIHSDIDELQVLLAKILKHKEIIEESKKLKEISINRIKSKSLMIVFRKKLKDFYKKIYFLLSYRFPNDHFELRENYDLYKNSKNEAEKKQRNQIYFYRKIVQDGAQNTNRSRSDTFIRTILDTIYLKLDLEKEVISEELRYDISWILRNLKLHLKRYRKRGILRRLSEWKSRTMAAVSFYESLRKDKIKIGNSVQTSLAILGYREKARYRLKDFVQDQQGKVYRFWKKESELMRALYSLDTILYNEVGSIDGKDALERKDVAQVVINRSIMPKYNSIYPDDSIYKYLADPGQKDKLKKYRWLNLMLKEGEFSFTYFFIPGNLRIYCPSTTRSAKRLRRKNLKLALELLKNPNWSFRATRYFSRASMLGRISMDKLWNDFVPVRERPGNVVPNNIQLQNEYRSKNYKYLYSFKDPSDREYRVIEINNSTYAMSKDDSIIYSYRSPHFFKYFRQ